MPCIRPKTDNLAPLFCLAVDRYSAQHLLYINGAPLSIINSTRRPVLLQFHLPRISVNLVPEPRRFFSAMGVELIFYGDKVEQRRPRICVCQTNTLIFTDITFVYTNPSTS